METISAATFLSVVEERDVGSRLVVADIDGTPIEKELMTDGKNEIIALLMKATALCKNIFCSLLIRCVQLQMLLFQ